MSNLALRETIKKREDGFFTSYDDICRELQYYKEHFRGKTVFCNCNDFSSQFAVYFINNFEELGLKKLIAMGYKKGGKGSVSLYEGAVEAQYELEGDGSYSSPERLSYLKETDIVVTNPPFSTIRDFFNVIKDKQFLFIAPVYFAGYVEIFPYIKDNRLWYGVTRPHTFISNAENKVVKLGNTCWCTNLDHYKRHELLPLTKKYYGNERDYPKYDNYDAINVDKVRNIPCDYAGAMGVPLTFLEHYNPDQFELIKLRKGNDGKDLTYTIRNAKIPNGTERNGTERNGKGYANDCYIDSKKIFMRVIVKKRGK